MNSSLPCAAESFADAAQSIASTSSPGWYGREPATSLPIPRRALCIAPNATPITRRRAVSGQVRSPCGTRAPSHVRGLGGRAWRAAEALLLERGDGVGPADLERVRDERRPVDDAVD